MVLDFESDFDSNNNISINSYYYCVHKKITEMGGEIIMCTGIVLILAGVVGLVGMAVFIISGRNK